MKRFATLCHKELLRFFKVSIQTVAAPVLTALLYLVIFGHALEGRVQVYEGVRYTSFLVPGLVMMSVLQNAFANSSSSLIQSKITATSSSCCSRRSPTSSSSPPTSSPPSFAA
jgi:ABC-2 type transport system permease protein